MRDCVDDALCLYDSRGMAKALKASALIDTRVIWCGDNDWY
jgi:hypothetical protein